MKIKSIALFLLFPMAAWGQRPFLFPTDESGFFKIDEVVHTEMPKEEMFNNALSWLSKNVGKRDIQLQSKNDEIIIANVAFMCFGAGSNKLNSERVYFTLITKFKDNKFRVQVENFFTNPIDCFDGEEMNLHNHLGAYENYREHSLDSISIALKIDSLLNSRDASSLSKRDKKKCEEELEKLQNKIKHSFYTCNDQYAYHEEEYNGVMAFIGQLKSAIQHKDEW